MSICHSEVLDLVIHRVSQGETLYGIAGVYGVPASSIAEVNGLSETDELVTGMELVIPVGDTINNQLLRVLQNRPSIETLGYLLPGAAAANLVRQIGPDLTYLGLFDFPVTETGEIQGTLDEDILTAANEVNTALLPVLTNNRAEEGFSPELGHSIIEAANRQNFIGNVLEMLDQYDLRGIIIDFENLNPEDRNLFTEFIGQLAQELHDDGKILILNLAPKWEDVPDASWSGFFDYSALGPLVDRAAIMTYEWGYISGPPQPTAPIENVRRVLAFALANNIPADKILMGMTLYGYNWELPDTPDNLATTVTQPQVWDLARRYGAFIQFDETAGQPSLNYINDQGTEHEIWFEDARSHYLKYQLAMETGLRGVFYWIINQPFPGTYYMVTHLFTVEKL